MTRWSEDGRQAIAAIAERHGFGAEAAGAMAEAIIAGNGRMAQFGHPELGGMGQWSRGGMLMIGDMFNNGLKARVGSLAEDLAASFADGTLGVEETVSDTDAATDRGQPPSAPAGTQAGSGSTLRSAGAPRLGAAWWPGELGAPGSSGAQNGRRYAVFPQRRRLAVEQDGKVTLYDTGDHDIGGVSQAQGSGDTLRFTSQLGSIDLSDLTEVEGRPDGKQQAQQPGATSPSSGSGLRATPAPRLATAADFPAIDPAGRQEMPKPSRSPGAADGPDIIDTIRRLADLRDGGILTPEEFAAKKAELLGRL